MIIGGYRLFDSRGEGDPKQLPGAKDTNRGAQSGVPAERRSARLEAPSMPTMQQEMTHFGNVVSNQVDAYANAVANPMQMMRRQQPPSPEQPMYPPRRQQQPMQQQPMPPPPPAQPMYPSPPTQQQPMPPQPQPTAMQSHDASDAERQPDAGADAGAAKPPRRIRCRCYRGARDREPRSRRAGDHASFVNATIVYDILHRESSSNRDHSLARAHLAQTRQRFSSASASPASARRRGSCRRCVVPSSARRVPRDRSDFRRACRAAKSRRRCGARTRRAGGSSAGIGRVPRNRGGFLEYEMHVEQHPRDHRRGV